MPGDQTYSLICDKCGEIFLSQEAFPSPQLCPKCKNDEELLPTELEQSVYQDLIAYLNDEKNLFEATASILAKAKPIYDKEKQEAVKAERERIFTFLEEKWQRRVGESWQKTFSPEELSKMNELSKAILGTLQALKRGTMPE